ncbi:hypothetical protein V8G54_021767 [Vigna mungo]|uniref:Oleosin n=1 Tax=Vigna mungo TaxID=3915 RepID=A0AAQ3NG72_VIGMU
MSRSTPQLHLDMSFYESGGKTRSYPAERVPSATQILSVVVGLPVGGLLLLLAGLTLAGTLTGLAVAIPLFILFSPVLVPATVVIGLVVAGFLTAGAFELTAVSSFSWILNYIRERQGPVPVNLAVAAKHQLADAAEYVGQKTKEVGQKTKEVGQDIQNKAQDAKEKSLKEAKDAKEMKRTTYCDMMSGNNNVPLVVSAVSSVIRDVLWFMPYKGVLLVTTLVVYMDAGNVFCSSSPSMLTDHPDQPSRWTLPLTHHPDIIQRSISNRIQWVSSEDAETYAENVEEVQCENNSTKSRAYFWLERTESRAEQGKKEAVFQSGRGLEKYDGSTYPNEHLRSIVNAIALNSSSNTTAKIMGELQQRAVEFMCIEEIRIFSKGSKTRNMFHSLGDVGSGPKLRDLPKGSNFNRYTLLNALRAKISKENLSVNLLPPLRKLIWIGYLKKYVKDEQVERSPPKKGRFGHPPQRNACQLNNQRRSKSKTRSRERSLIILLHTKKASEELENCSPGGQEAKEDPLVITAVIASYNVTRGYVDLITCPETGRKLNVRYLPVEANTSYNFLIVDYETSLGQGNHLYHSSRLEGLKDEPFIPHHNTRCFEVVMEDLDPRTNTKDHMEPLGEVRSFGLRRSEEQVMTIGSGLTKTQASAIGEELKSNNDLFAWIVMDISNIHSSVMSHKLALFKEAGLVAQKKRRLDDKKKGAVDAEFRKLLEDGFIQEVMYSTWLANIGFGLRFLDSYSGYNQIPIYHSDNEKMAFTIERSNYCYENVGVIYQHLMDKVFHHQIRRCMEVYVDDMMVRSRLVEEYVKDLAENLEEVPRLVGHLTSLSRFIPRLAHRIRPILEVMKKNALTQWDDQCEATFAEVREILAKSSVMGRLVPEHDLHLFFIVSEGTINAALVQEALKFKLILVGRKYSLSPTYNRSMIKALLSRSSSDCSNRSSYSKNIEKTRPRRENGRVVIGAIRIRFMFRIIFGGRVALNNLESIAALEAFLWMDRLTSKEEGQEDLKATYLECRTDSQLVVGQMDGSFQTRNDQLLQYFHKVKDLVKNFKTFLMKHIPRAENAWTDTLSKLADGIDKGQLSSIIRQVLMKPFIECLSVTVASGLTYWRKEKIARYVLIDEELYWCSFSTPFLSVSDEEAEYILRELHEGVNGIKEIIAQEILYRCVPTELCLVSSAESSTIIFTRLQMSISSTPGFTLSICTTPSTQQPKPRFPLSICTTPVTTITESQNLATMSMTTLFGKVREHEIELERLKEEEDQEIKRNIVFKVEVVNSKIVKYDFDCENPIELIKMLTNSLSSSASSINDFNEQENICLMDNDIVGSQISTSGDSDNVDDIDLDED